MIIFIFGAPKIGKSIISQYLAERLNVSNVLQTSIVQMMMKLLNSEFFANTEHFQVKDINE